jgi:hypothetical protein
MYVNHNIRARLNLDCAARQAGCAALPTSRRRRLASRILSPARVCTAQRLVSSAPIVAGRETRVFLASKAPRLNNKNADVRGCQQSGDDGVIPLRDIGDLAADPQAEIA